MNIFLAQIFRIIGSIFSILSDTSNNTKRIFSFNAIANVFCGIQYFLLNAFTGFMGCAIAIPRNIIFYKYKNKVPLFILIIYFIITILINIPSVDSLISAIPILLVLIYTYALYVADKEFIKWSVIFICVLEIIYDIKYNAYIGIIVCFLDIVLVSISLVKLYKKNGKKK